MTEYKTDVQKKKFYRTSEWNKLRQQALIRDNFECQWCKKEGKATVDSIKEKGKRKDIVLNVDHKYGIENYPQLALVLNNLETLCVYHHNVKEGRVFGQTKKKRWDDERW